MKIKLIFSRPNFRRKYGYDNDLDIYIGEDIEYEDIEYGEGEIHITFAITYRNIKYPNYFQGINYNNYYRTNPFKIYNVYL